MKTKHCPGCDEYKPESDFYPHGTSKDRLSFLCIECMKDKPRDGTRPPISNEQVKIMLAMLKLMMGEDNKFLSKKAISTINPGLKTIGRLINKGLIERESYLTVDKVKEYRYGFTSDGRTVAEAMLILTRHENQRHEDPQ